MMDNCILWTHRTDADGYGRRAVPGASSALAHRVAYERAHGPIPEGMTVDHLCFVKLCVNPAHLRLLSPLENQRNQRSAHKTHCKNGHEFTPKNTYIRPRRYREGTRACRMCNLNNVVRYQARKRAV